MCSLFLQVLSQSHNFKYHLNNQISMASTSKLSNFMTASMERLLLLLLCFSIYSIISKIAKEYVNCC